MTPRVIKAAIVFGWAMAVWWCGSSLAALSQGSNEWRTYLALYFATVAMLMHFQPPRKNGKRHG